MTNQISAAGLTINSVSDIVAILTAGMQAIYGADINVDSNSPDGQLINLYAQVAADQLELLAQVYNSFTIDNAFGTILDQRVAIGGIARKQGTFTTTPVLVTTNQALTLTGQDALVSDPTASVYTISDNAGNQYQLETTQVISGAGSVTYTFVAVAIGQVEVTPNTITNQITTVLGVTAINNPTTAGTITGVNEETDAQLKVRYFQSFALASTGPADAVEAALLAIPDVTDAIVIENFTDATVNTVPPHAIWCIVTGGTAAEIAQAIYAKKGIGCDMKGSQSHVITRPNGTSFDALWDTSISQDLHIQFTINPVTPGVSFDTVLLATQLATALIYKLGQAPTVGNVITAMLALAPNAYLTNIGVSKDGISYFDVVQPNTAQYYFTVLAVNIIINT